MRVFFLIGSIALGVLARPAQADEPTQVATESGSPKNVFVFNPGELLGGVLAIEYERGLGSWFGLTLGVGLSLFPSVFIPTSESNLIAIGPEVGVRIHFIQDAPAGLWLGPAVSVAYLTQRVGGAPARNFGYGLSAAIGYTFILGAHFAFQLGAGGGFTDYGNGPVWSPRLRFGLGAAF